MFIPAVLVCCSNMPAAVAAADAFQFSDGLRQLKILHCLFDFLLVGAGRRRPMTHSFNVAIHAVEMLVGCPSSATSAIKVKSPVVREPARPE